MPSLTEQTDAGRYDAILRRLAEEAEALPAAKPTSWPPIDFLNYRTKNPERYEQDRKRAHFLSRVKEEIPSSGRGGLAERYPDINAAMSQIDQFASPYEPYGEDHPLWNAAVWMQSLPSAVYATGQMLANKVDPVANPYPDAPEQFAKSVNTFTAPLDAPMAIGLPGMSTESLGILPKNLSRWRDLQDMRTEMTPSWKTIDPRLGDALVKAKYKPDVLDGETFLEGAGVPESYAPYLGAAMDAAIDPFTGYSQASRLSRLGRNVDALKTLGVDFGLGVAPVAIPAAARGVGDAASSIRKLLNEDY